MKLSTIFIPAAVISIAIAVGWTLNVYKLATNCDFQSPYSCEVIRIIGIVPPIGAIVGWLDLGK